MSPQLRELADELAERQDVRVEAHDVESEFSAEVERMLERL